MNIINVMPYKKSKIFIAATLCIILSACGGGSRSNNTSGSGSTGTPTQPTPPVTPTPPVSPPTNPTPPVSPPTPPVSPPVSNPTAILSWTVSTAPTVVTYRVYYGMQSNTYLQPLGSGLDAGNVETYTVKGLQSGQAYYFAVTAVDNEGNESAYSNEAIKIIQ